jgi:ABC-type uncharacterized transport system substrate-binding protein
MVAMAVIGLLMGVTVSAARQKVLVIHSYHEELAWVGQCDRGIAEILGGMAEVETVYLDTKRIPESGFQARAEAAMDTLARFRPDVVMLGDDNALRLLGPVIAETGTPVVFFGINNNPRKYFGTMPDNVTGVLERVALFPWIRFLKDIVPNAASALVLMDRSQTSKAIIESTFGERRMVSVEGVSVEYRVALDWAEWQRIVLRLHDIDFVTIPVYHSLQDTSGVHVPVEAVVRWTSEHARVPVFAHQDYAVGDSGVVGAYVVFGESHARHAAQLVRDILEGRTPKAPPAFMDQDGQFYFNELQLHRYGLTLPAEIREKAVFR